MRGPTLRHHGELRRDLTMFARPSHQTRLSICSLVRMKCRGSAVDDATRTTQQIVKAVWHRWRRGNFGCRLMHRKERTFAPPDRTRVNGGAASSFSCSRVQTPESRVPRTHPVPCLVHQQQQHVSTHQFSHRHASDDADHTLPRARRPFSLLFSDLKLS